eukprot:COSAG01_NODE_12300_length_1764_cov_1.006607_1_plen_257_part_10
MRPQWLWIHTAAASHANVQVHSSLGASGLAIPIVDSHSQLPPCEEGDPPSLIYQTDAALNMQQLLTCSSQNGAADWRSVLVQGGLIYHGPAASQWAGAVNSGLPGVIQLDLPPQARTINQDLTIEGGQLARVLGNQDSVLKFPHSVTISGGLTLDGGRATFSGGVEVARSGTLTLNSLLTVTNGVAVLGDLVTSLGKVIFASGGVTIANAQGDTLGTAKGSLPGDVHLTQLTKAGKAAFSTASSSATLSHVKATWSD